MDWRIPYAALREAFPQVDSEVLKAAVSRFGDNVHQAADYILNECAPPDLSVSALRQASSSRNARAAAGAGSGAGSSPSSNRRGLDSNGDVNSSTANSGGRGRGASTATAAAAAGSSNKSAGSGSGTTSSQRKSSSHRQQPSGSRSPGSGGKEVENRTKNAGVAKRGALTLKPVPDEARSKTLSELAGLAAPAAVPEAGAGNVPGRTVVMAAEPAVDVRAEKLDSGVGRSGVSSGTTDVSQAQDESIVKEGKAHGSDRVDVQDATAGEDLKVAASLDGELHGSGGHSEDGAGSSDSDKLVRRPYPANYRSDAEGGLSGVNENGSSERSIDHLETESTAETGTITPMTTSKGDSIEKWRLQLESQTSGYAGAGSKEGESLLVEDLGPVVQANDINENEECGLSNGDGEETSVESLSSQSRSSTSVSSRGTNDGDAATGVMLSQDKEVQMDSDSSEGKKPLQEENEDESAMVREGGREEKAGEVEINVQLEKGSVAKGKGPETGAELNEVSGGCLECHNGKMETSEGGEAGMPGGADARDGVSGKEGEGDEGEASWESSKGEGSATMLQHEVPIEGATKTALSDGPAPDLFMSTSASDWPEINEETVASLGTLVSEALSWKDLLRQKIAETRALQAEAEATEAAASKAQEEAKKGGKAEWLQVVSLKEKLERTREAIEQRAGDVHGEQAVLATEVRELRSRLVHVAADKAAALERLKEVELTLESRIMAARKALREAEDEWNTAKESACNALAAEEAKMARVEKEAEKLEQEAEICTKLREFLIAQGSNVDSLQGEIAYILEDVEALKRQQLDTGGGLGSGYVPIGSATSTHQSRSSFQTYPLVSSGIASAKTAYAWLSSSTSFAVQEGGMLGNSALDSRPLPLLGGSQNGFRSSAGDTSKNTPFFRLGHSLGGKDAWNSERNGVCSGGVPLSVAGYVNGSRSCAGQDTPTTYLQDPTNMGGASVVEKGDSTIELPVAATMEVAADGTPLASARGGYSAAMVPAETLSMSNERPDATVEYFEDEAAEQIEYEMRLDMSRNESARAALSKSLGLQDCCYNQGLPLLKEGLSGLERLGGTFPVSAGGPKSGFDDDGWQFLEMGGGGAEGNKERSDTYYTPVADAPQNSPAHKCATMTNQSVVHQPVPDAAVIL